MQEKLERAKKKAKIAARTKLSFTGDDEEEGEEEEKASPVSIQKIILYCHCMHATLSQEDLALRNATKQSPCHMHADILAMCHASRRVHCITVGMHRRSQGVV